MTTLVPELPSATEIWRTGALAAWDATVDPFAPRVTVYVVPEAIDKEVARLKLKSMGTGIDTLTPEQVKYLATWSEGT